MRQSEFYFVRRETELRESCLRSRRSPTLRNDEETVHPNSKLREKISNKFILKNHLLNFT